MDDIWAWGCVEGDLAVARMARLESMGVAAKAACVCPGLWERHVLQALELNRIDAKHVFQDIHALATGRSETAPGIVLAGTRGGEGKSMLLKGLLPLFGYRHACKGLAPGSFPMADLPGKKVVFASEWRFDASSFPFAAQCLR